MNGTFVDSLPVETVGMSWFVRRPEPMWPTDLDSYVAGTWDTFDLSIAFPHRYLAVVRVYRMANRDDLMADRRKPGMYRLLNATGVFLDDTGTETFHFVDINGVLNTSATFSGAVAGVVTLRHPRAVPINRSA